MNIVDISYNYLNGLNCEKFKADFLSIISRNIGGEKKWVRAINKKPYIDPDSKCKKLYEDLKLYYDGLKFPNGNFIEVVDIVERKKNNESYYELKINIINKEKNTNTVIAQIGLGADYIGPSIHWACEAGITPIEIGTFLETTRTFGGHILWPRWIGIPNRNGHNSYDFIKGFETINVCRGGDKGFYDRIDLTLFDLKEWYLKHSCKLQYAYDKNKIWLKQFIDFNQFIDFFKMNDFVSEKEYEIKNFCTFYEGEKFKYLTSNDVYPALIPGDRITYSKLIDASVHLTNLRNASLNKH